MVSNIMLSALKFVCGENEHICRLCFAVVEDQEISVEETVELQKDYFDGVVTFADIFHDLGIQSEPMLPQIICMKCAGHAINSYLFQKLCQHSTEKWDHVLNRLNDGMSQSNVIESGCNTMYFLFNQNDSLLITRRKTNTCDKKTALVNIRSIMKSRSNYLKIKEKKLSCAECNTKFKSKFLLTKHMRLHNKFQSPPVPCTQCDKVFLTKLQLETHAERVHHPKRIRCPKCPKKFSTERLLSYHNKIHHVAAKCHLCYKNFPSKKELRIHLNRHEVPNCPRCFKSFKNKTTYKFHLTICGAVKELKFFCDLCNKGYVRKNGLRSHLKTDHGFGDVISCEWCGKKFDAISKLNNHAVKHTRERKFQCEQCNGKFVTSAALLYHTRLHTGERPFPCDLCNESFLSSSRRMEHKRRKHFGPTKECHMCHMKYTTTHQLKKHIQRHYNPQSKLYVPDTDGTRYIFETEFET